MGKHKRQTDREPEDDVAVHEATAAGEINSLAPEPEDESLISPRKKVKKHKHKKSRDESAEREPEPEHERPELPSKSKSKHKHTLEQNQNGYAQEPDDDGNEDDRGRSRSLISPPKSKKKKSSDKDSHHDLAVNGIHDYDDQLSKPMKKEPVRSTFAVDTEDPLTAKFLQDMKKGLVGAAIGDPGILAAEELESDDVEIFIIQCPENVNPAQLLDGKKIKFGNDSVTPLVATEDEKYESVFLTDENEKTVTIVLPDSFGNPRVVSSTLAGHIVVREAIDELLIPTLLAEDKPAHELPAGLKERHPVFGTDFTIPLKSLAYDGKRKSKKKNKSSEDPEIQVAKYDYEDIPASANPTSKEKRHKRNEIAEPTAIETDDSRSKKKKKKDKRSRDDVEEELIEKVEIKPTIEENSGPELDYGQSKKKKKKKDKKSRSEVY